MSGSPSAAEIRPDLDNCSFVPEVEVAVVESARVSQLHVLTNEGAPPQWPLKIFRDGSAISAAFTDQAFLPLS
jgi:hypothetical protein